MFLIIRTLSIIFAYRLGIPFSVPSLLTGALNPLAPLRGIYLFSLTKSEPLTYRVQVPVVSALANII